MKQKISQKSIDIISKTAALVTSNDTKITTRMYEIVFDKHPDIKKLFANASQNQYMKLAEALSAYAININILDKLTPALEVIASKHVGANIRPGHYPIIGMALIEAMEDVLGDRASIEFLDAWREVYKYLSDVLIEIEERMYGEIS